MANDKFLLENLDKIFFEYEIEKIVLGYPVKENGEASSSTKLVEDFKFKLSEFTKIQIILFDERYSSHIAKQRIIESISSKKKRRDKSIVDKNAAAIILEDFLREARN